MQVVMRWKRKELKEGVKEDMRRRNGDEPEIKGDSRKEMQMLD